ncbi:MAG: SGNH/GDSL hydrolase family protein [Sulfurovum sp.]|nr:SGNH/GDSL hydrolase family protein [Sulfurovum sp.]
MKLYRVSNKHITYLLSTFIIVSLVGCEYSGKTNDTPASVKNTDTQDAEHLTNAPTLTASKKKKILFAIAGDSKRADDAAQEEIFYSRWLKEFNVDYLHTAVTSIESHTWTNGKQSIVKAQLPRIVEKAKEYGSDGENVIIAYELGTNDIDHCKSQERINAIRNKDKVQVEVIEKECKNIVFESLKTGITAIQTALPSASIYLSRPALAAKPRLKEIYERLAKEFNLLLVDSPIEKYMEQDPKKPKNGPEGFKYLKDNTHPSYAGMLSTLYADLNCILPKEKKGKLRAKVNESLYSDTTSKQGQNIAKGIKLQKEIRASDEEATKGEKYRSLTVPVIGGSILKIESPVKIEGIIAVDKNDKGIDGNSLTNSRLDSSLLRTKASNLETGRYEFIYIPKGTAQIIINLAILNVPRVHDVLLEKTPMRLTYASPEEMKKWHPDLKEITSNQAKCIQSEYWDMNLWKTN